MAHSLQYLCCSTQAAVPCCLPHPAVQDTFRAAFHLAGKAKQYQQVILPAGVLQGVLHRLCGFLVPYQYQEVLRARVLQGALGGAFELR